MLKAADTGDDPELTTLWIRVPGIISLDEIKRDNKNLLSSVAGVSCINIEWYRRNDFCDRLSLTFVTRRACNNWDECAVLLKPKHCLM